MSPKARRALALPLDQSNNRGRRSDTEAHGDPGRVNPKDLPRTVCARDWSMSLSNHAVEQPAGSHSLAAAGHRGRYALARLPA